MASYYVNSYILKVEVKKAVPLKGSDRGRGFGRGRGRGGRGRG